MNWTHDLRFAWRSLIKSPGFLVVAALSLGLGIALNTTMFGLVHSSLFRVPDVEEPERLVSIYNLEEGETDRNMQSVPDYLDLAEQTRTFSELFGQSLAVINVQRDGRPTPLIGSVVTANFFDALGVEAQEGRTFFSAEAVGGDAVPTVVLTDSYWRRAFGADPEVLEQPLRIGGVDFEVVGVLPPRFRGLLRGLQPDLFVPLAQVEHVEPMGEISTEGPSRGLGTLERRGFRFLTVFGRLAPDATLEQAETELATLAANLASEYPQSNQDRGAVLIPTLQIAIDPDLDEVIVPAAMVTMGLVAMVLLVACANIGNMLLARAEGRRREIAVRLSLGAGRWQLVRLLLLESVLLSLIAGLAGLGLAAVAMRLLSQIRLDLPIEVPLDPRLDPPVLLFTLAISLATGLLFGLLPALRSARRDLVPDLKAEEGVETVRGWRAWLQPARALVVVQIALCLTLLVGAGLLQRSVVQARAVDVGFDAESLGAAFLDLSAVAEDGADRATAWRDLIARVEAMPGVESAAVATRSPLELNIHTSDFFIPGHRETESDESLYLDVTQADNAFFDTLGIAIEEGSPFPVAGTVTTEGEDEERRLAIVSRAMAERFWPGESAVGRTFRTTSADGPQWTILGVSEDYKVRTPGETPRPMVHFFLDDSGPQFGNLIYRARGRAGTLQTAVTETLLTAEPDLFLLESTTFDRRRDLVLLPIRVGGILVSGLGLLALVLAAVGLAGLIAYWVSRRTREIGIRIAVGADRSRITRLVMARSLGLVAVGGLLGLLGSVALGKLLQSVLYVDALDPLSFLTGTAVLVAAAVLATLVPVRRATAVSPVTALRS